MLIFVHLRLMRLLARTSAFAFIALLGVFLVFFCPAARGPFSVPHSPVADFRAWTAASALFASMRSALLLGLMRCVALLQAVRMIAAQMQRASDSFALRC
jgi:hypothetical protein